MSLSFSETLLVPDEYSTIQFAIDVASDGDTVSVSSGTYYENIIWPATNGIKLIGSGEDNCFINGDQVSSVIRFDEELSGLIDASTLITGFTIQNGSSDQGGGMYLWESSPTLAYLIFRGNFAFNGAGLYLAESHPTLYYVTISENTTSNYGGGMYLYSSNPILTHLTITRNIGSYGGGLFIESSHPTLTNSIIWDNNSEAIFLFIVYEQPTITYSNIEGGWEGEGNINDDPLFTNPENSNYRLQTGSPCIDTGTSDINLNEFENFVDFIGTAPDMGVHEGGTGCTDSEAINYNSEATIDQGCLFYDIDALNIFISEYIEGSLQIRAIEVYNPTDSPINLFGLELWIINSGGDWVEGSAYNELFPEYVLEPGDVFVFCGSDFSQECDFIDILPFGGDDVVGLVYDGTVIDQVGNEGDDPGSGWIVSGIEDATYNHTLVRNPDVLLGEIDWENSSQSGWIVYDIDIIDHLGYHIINDGAPISGDINLDGNVDILDILQILNYIIGNLEFSVDEFISADYNIDGSINVLDIVDIIIYILS